MVSWKRGAVLIVILLSVVAPVHAQSQPQPPARPNIFSQPLTNLDALIIVQSWWHAADMITTAYDLQHGAREGNPILAPFTEHPVALSIVSGALDVLEAYAVKKIAVRHRKLAHICAGALLASKIWATASNVRVAGELQRHRGP